MSHAPETLERSADLPPGGAAAREPGIVLLFLDGAPTFEVTVLPRGGIDIGRQPGAGLAIADGHMSRLHVRVARQDSRWHVRDLGSRNGTFVDGRRAIDELLDDGRHLVRVGSSLLLLAPEVPEPDARAVIIDDEGHVVGPTLAAQLETLGRFSTSNRVVHLRGETGSGKELAARRFHLAGPNPSGPFVAVNCGAIPRELAEGLLFGAKRGAYTGAVGDTDGYLLSAAGGTVFLDEVGELAPAVQAKLLRVLETHEVVQLGASRGQKVDLRICSATHKDLRAEAAEGGE